MTKLEKRLCIFALIFVAVYIGAIVATIKSRTGGREKVTRIESVQPDPAESRLMLAELFLPMTILLVVTVSFIVVKRQRSKIDFDEDEDDDLKP